MAVSGGGGGGRAEGGDFSSLGAAVEEVRVCRNQQGDQKRLRSQSRTDGGELCNKGHRHVTNHKGWVEDNHFRHLVFLIVFDIYLMSGRIIKSVTKKSEAPRPKTVVFRNVTQGLSVRTKSKGYWEEQMRDTCVSVRRLNADSGSMVVFHKPLPQINHQDQLGLGCAQIRAQNLR